MSDEKKPSTFSGRPNQKLKADRRAPTAISPLITHHLSPFYETPLRQAQQHRRHRARAPRAGGGAESAAARGDCLGGRAALGGNSEGQPSRKYPHRSGHEGSEALAD